MPSPNRNSSSSKSFLEFSKSEGSPYIGNHLEIATQNCERTNITSATSYVDISCIIHMPCQRLNWNIAVLYNIRSYVTADKIALGNYFLEFYLPRLNVTLFCRTQSLISKQNQEKQNSKNKMAEISCFPQRIGISQIPVLIQITDFNEYSP